MNKYEKFVQIAKNDEKAREIFSESIEETIENLQKVGLEFTEDELLECAEAIRIKANGTELDENQLSDVNGGILFSSLVAAGWYAIGTYAFSSAALIWLKRR